VRARQGKTESSRGLAEQLSPHVLLFYSKQYVHLYEGQIQLCSRAVYDLLG